MVRVWFFDKALQAVNRPFPRRASAPVQARGNRIPSPVASAGRQRSAGRLRARPAEPPPPWPSRNGSHRRSRDQPGARCRRPPNPVRARCGQRNLRTPQCCVPPVRQGRCLLAAREGLRGWPRPSPRSSQPTPAPAAPDFRVARMSSAVVAYRLRAPEIVWDGSAARRARIWFPIHRP